MVALQRPPGGAVGRAVPTDSAHSGMASVLTKGPDTAAIGQAPHDGNFALLLEIASLASSHRMKTTAMVSPSDMAQPVDLRPVDLRPVDLRPVDLRPIDASPFDVRPLKPSASGQPLRLPDTKQVVWIGRVAFLVVAAIIGTQVLKSVFGLSFEDALPLLVLAGIAFAVFRKRRGPPQN
jgi:hypothetical protein